MLARFSRFLTFTAVAALAVASCTRETPLQPLRPDVVAQDTASPAPPNDNRDSARFIPFVPFFDSTDVTNATVEPGEVTSFCHDTIGAPTRTVWYVYVSQAPGSVQLTAQLRGPAPGILSTYFVSADTLIPVGCNSNFGPVTFNADSGSAFYFQISDSAGATGPTVFSLQQDSGPPPPPPPPPPSGNDNFADAELAPGIPFTATAVFDFATREPNEPAFCFFNSRTVWYRFTPTTTQAVTAGLQAPFFDGLTVYQGTSLNSLSFLRCASSFSGPVSFTAVAGQTYYFQVGSDQPGTATFSLQPPPPPQANFFTQPFDPSSFDLVRKAATTPAIEVRSVVRSGRRRDSDAAVGFRRRGGGHGFQPHASVRGRRRLPGDADGHDIRWSNGIDHANPAGADARRRHHTLCDAGDRHDRQDQPDFGGHQEQPVSRDGSGTAVQECAGRVPARLHLGPDTPNPRPSDDAVVQLCVHS